MNGESTRDRPDYADEPWFKLQRRIFQSSIWEEDPATRIVWITLLHLAQLPENRKHGHGMVLITRGNLCREAFVAAEQLEHALARLTAPDPTSRTDPDRGRIEVLQNGYRIRSFDRYHDVAEYDSWHAQRVAAGKARAAKAKRAEEPSGRGGRGRFTSEQPATAGNEPARSLVSTRMTETETETETTDGTASVPSRLSPRMTSKTATKTATAIENTAAKEELLAVCASIARRLKTTKTAVLARVSAIPPSNGRPAKTFTDPREKGISIGWVRRSLARARELAAALERPVPL